MRTPGPIRLAPIFIIALSCLSKSDLAAPKPGVSARLVTLRLSPSSIILNGPGATQRLVATGRYSDGSELDVTAHAHFRLIMPGIARLDAGDALAPLHNGATAVVAQIGPLSARAPVRVVHADKIEPVRLDRDIEPILTKIGCNQGACHGRQKGQGSFRLSLRAWDPAADWEQIVRADKGRRIDLANPERSLVLLKPTMQLPHGGGLRLTKGSPEYRLILRWIKAGAPRPNEKVGRLVDVSVTPSECILPRPGLPQRLLVTARYSDGTIRDVTSLARYQSQNDAVANVDDFGDVTTKQPGESAIMVMYGGEVKIARMLIPYPAPALDTERFPRANYIDDLVYAKLAKLHIPPSGRANDTEFLRRVSLDVIATLPTPEETRAFVADPDPNKRAKLIDHLLERPEYVDYRTLRLCDLLRVNGQFLSEEGADVYYRWIHHCVQQNMPYDQFVRALLTGRGSTFHVGPANFYRVTSSPEELAETTAQTFLGVRIQCAKCHNHPFEKWKQSDYYGLAAFFARVGQKDGPEFSETQTYVRRDGEVNSPRTKQVVPARFLGGVAPTFTEDEDRRAVLADWLTAKDNLDFARVAVNRIWADYFGKGIVDPVDDFRISNPPSNTPLLDALAKDFIAHGYDVKAITRLILNSETYQRSSVALPGNRKEERYFARSYPRRLPAEALADAIAQVTEKPDHFGSYPQGWRAIQVRDSRIDSYFLSVFGRPKREILCACERSVQPNLAQSLHLINSDNLNHKLSSDDGRVAHLLKQYEKADPATADRQIVNDLYMIALCRLPTQKEQKNILAYVAKRKDRHKGFEDTLWALMNSEEFMFNH